MVIITTSVVGHLLTVGHLVRVITATIGKIPEGQVKHGLQAYKRFLALGKTVFFLVLQTCSGIVILAT